MTMFRNASSSSLRMVTMSSTNGLPPFPECGPVQQAASLSNRLHVRTSVRSGFALLFYDLPPFEDVGRRRVGVRSVAWAAPAVVWPIHQWPTTQPLIQGLRPAREQALAAAVLVEHVEQRLTIGLP